MRNNKNEVSQKHKKVFLCKKNFYNVIFIKYFCCLGFRKFLTFPFNKLDDIVNKYNNTYHRTIKMKTVDIKSSIYDCNWTRTKNHLVLKRTLNHLTRTYSQAYILTLIKKIKRKVQHLQMMIM